MPPGQKAKCQSSSKITTERKPELKENLRDDRMLAVRYLNDLEITFPLRLPERSIKLFKERNIITQVSRFNSTPE